MPPKSKSKAAAATAAAAKTSLFPAPPPGWRVLCWASEMSLQATLQSGQTFRWFPVVVDSPSESNNNNHINFQTVEAARSAIWRGIIGRQCIDLKEDFERGVILARSGLPPHTADSVDLAPLRRAFFLDEDLSALLVQWQHQPPPLQQTQQQKKSSKQQSNNSNTNNPLRTLFSQTISSAGDPHGCLRRVRLVLTEPIEIIFCFLCSQNNHLKRITAMVNAIASYGEDLLTTTTAAIGTKKTANHSKTAAATTADSRFCFKKFPDATAISKVSEKKWRDLGFGYRAKYITESAKKIAAEGDANFCNRVRRSTTLAEARAVLMELPGVGRKVADCILLYGFSDVPLCRRVAPMDTHMIFIVRAASGGTEAATATATAAAAKKKKVEESSSSDEEEEDDDDDGDKKKKAKKKKKQKQPKVVFKPADHDRAQEDFYQAFGEFAGWAQMIFFASRVNNGMFASAAAPTVAAAADAAGTKKLVESGTRRGRE